MLGIYKSNNKQEVVLYRHKINAKHSNFIKLSSDSSFVDALFYGTEFQKDGTPVYYRAKLENVKVNDTEISFILTHYSFSKRPMGNHNDYSPNFPYSGEIPILLRLRQFFSGSISHEKLELQRYSEIYPGSRTDKMKFARQWQVPAR